MTAAGQPPPPPPPSRRVTLVATVSRWRDAGRDRAVELERHLWPLAVAHHFSDRYRDVNGVVLSGHLAFRGFMFLLPLVFVFVAVAGVLHASGHDPAETTDQLQLGEAVAASMRLAGEQSGSAPWQAATAAFVGIVLGSLGLLSGLHYVFALAWRIEHRKIEGKVSKLVRFVVSFVLMLGILLLAASLRHRGFVLGTASVIGTGLLIAVLFVGLAAIMPHRGERIVDLVPGGIVGALGVIGLQAFATFYLPGKLDSFSSTYGALGIAAVVISYLFLIGQIVVASALASAVWYDERTSRNACPTPPPERSEDRPPFRG